MDTEKLKEKIAYLLWLHRNWSYSHCREEAAKMIKECQTETALT